MSGRAHDSMYSVVVREAWDPMGVEVYVRSADLTRALMPAPGGWQWIEVNPDESAGATVRFPADIGSLVLEACEEAAASGRAREIAVLRESLNVERDRVERMLRTVHARVIEVDT